MRSKLVVRPLAGLFGKRKAKFYFWFAMYGGVLVVKISMFSTFAPGRLYG